MKRAMLALAIDILARLGLGGLFIYSSWYKIQDPGLFADAVAGYAILPACFVGLFALILPMLEFVAGVALIVTKWSREAALILLGLLLSFFVGLSQAWIRGLEISCGCFGPDAGTPPPLWMDIIRVLFLLIPVVWLVVRPNGWLFHRPVKG